MFLMVGALIAWDLFVDHREGVSWPHFIVELFVFVVAVSGAVMLWRQLHRTREDLRYARDEASHWRQESQDLLKGLGVAIDHQFARWNLTAAEADVGLFLLKGLSHRQIADLRNTSERTVREQSRALYRKAGLSGRASLSAFFLEDLLLPPGDENGNGAGC